MIAGNIFNNVVEMDFDEELQNHLPSTKSTRDYIKIDIKQQ